MKQRSTSSGKPRADIRQTATKASMVKAFNYMMAMRYRVRNYREEDGLTVLRGLGLTKRCSARFAEIRKAHAAMAGTTP